jgi:hypothetical protein
MDSTPLWSSPFWGYGKGRLWRGRKRAVEGTPTVLSRAALALAVAAPAAMDGHHPLSGCMATLWILFGCGTREEEEGQEKKEKGGRNLPRLRAGRRLSSTPAITGRREDETLRRLCVREARGRKKNGLGLQGGAGRRRVLFA